VPINAADARQLAQVMLKAYGEDYGLIGSILKPLRTDFPGINWMNELTTIALAWQPFIDSGLSIQWWLDQVNRLSS